MIRERAVPVLLDDASDCSLAMWIVFSASHGDQPQTAGFVGSMVIGAVASLLFVLAC